MQHEKLYNLQKTARFCCMFFVFSETKFFSFYRQTSHIFLYSEKFCFAYLKCKISGSIEIVELFTPHFLP